MAADPVCGGVPPASCGHGKSGEAPDAAFLPEAARRLFLLIFPAGGTIFIKTGGGFGGLTKGGP